MRHRARLGMALFLLTEAVFFFMLILAFVYFRPDSVSTASARLKPWVTAIYTICLLASGLTMWRASAVAAAGRERAAGVRVWLGLTIALGSIFLIGQGGEYARLIRAGITMSQGLFGTTFFTLTGFHGLDLLLAIVLLIAMMVLAAAPVNERYGIAVSALAMYWYFLNAVWIAIFSIVYVWSFL